MYQKKYGTLSVKPNLTNLISLQTLTGDNTIYVEEFVSPVFNNIPQYTVYSKLKHIQSKMSMVFGIWRSGFDGGLNN